jgi:hypothetical protein
MISLEKYKELLDKGLDANHYVFLGFILNNKQLDGVVPKARLDSIHRTLIRKGMIVEVEDKFILTQEAINLISTQVVTTPSTATLNDVLDLNKVLKEALYKITGKRQVVGFGNTYFIPSAKDLETFLNRFRKAYPSLWNISNIEKCLVAHVEKCAKAGKYSPAVKYYIIKEGTGSQLAAALENMDDAIPEEKQHKILNTKDLFE